MLPIFGIDIPTATNAVTGYAFGVVLGAPLVTLVAAKLNRRTLLLLLMGLWVVGNVLSSMASNIGLFTVARFISGMPQGAYFGAGAVVAAYFFGADRAGKAFSLVMTGLTVATIFGSPLATFLGQTLGWRNTYLSMAALGSVALLALFLFIPRTEALRGGSVVHELSALRRLNVWAMIAVAALGISSIFAVYAFIGPLVTDVVQLDPSTIPLALGVFGVGMTVGNLVGGYLADTFLYRGLVLGYGLTLVMLVILSSLGTQHMGFLSLPLWRGCRDDGRSSNDSGAYDKLRPRSSNAHGGDEPGRPQRGECPWRMGRRTGHRGGIQRAVFTACRIRADCRRVGGLPDRAFSTCCDRTGLVVKSLACRSKPQPCKTAFRFVISQAY